MKMKLFRYGYLIRIAFDHGRIFPIIIKQRGVSQFIAGISSHIVEAPTNIWINLLNFDQQARILIHGVFAGWGTQLYLGISNVFHPEFLIQRIFG